MNEQEKKEHIPPLQRERMQEAGTGNRKQRREFTEEK